MLKSLEAHLTPHALRRIALLALFSVSLFSFSSDAFGVGLIPGYSTKSGGGGRSPFLSFFLSPQMGLRVRSYEHASSGRIPRSHGLSLQARTGFRIRNWLLLGVSPEYLLLQQFDKNGDFNGDWSGYELTTLKPIIGTNFGFIQILFGYGMNNELNLSQKTSLNQTLTYSDGIGYQVEVDFAAFNTGYFSIHYSFGKYKDQILDGTRTTLNNAVKWSSFGIGYTHALF